MMKLMNDWLRDNFHIWYLAATIVELILIGYIAFKR